MNEAPAPSLVGSEAETLDEAFHRHACNNRQIANEKKSAFILGDLFSQLVIKSPRRPVDPTAGRGARLAAAALSFAFENRADKEVAHFMSHTLQICSKHYQGLAGGAGFFYGPY